jgi:hypothetical protein
MDTNRTESIMDKLRNALRSPAMPFSEKLPPIDTHLLPDRDIAYEADTGASPSDFTFKSVGEVSAEKARQADFDLERLRREVGE